MSWGSHPAQEAPAGPRAPPTILGTPAAPQQPVPPCPVPTLGAPHRPLSTRPQPRGALAQPCPSEHPPKRILPRPWEQPPPLQCPAAPSQAGGVHQVPVWDAPVPASALGPGTAVPPYSTRGVSGSADTAPQPQQHSRPPQPLCHPQFLPVCPLPARGHSPCCAQPPGTAPLPQPARAGATLLLHSCLMGLQKSFETGHGFGSCWMCLCSLQLSAIARAASAAAPDQREGRAITSRHLHAFQSGAGSWALPPSRCQSCSPDPTRALRSSHRFPFKMLVRQHVKGRHLFQLSRCH